MIIRPDSGTAVVDLPEQAGAARAEAATVA